MIDLLEGVIDKETFFFYSAISIGILFFFTSIVKIELGHVLALFVSISILLSLSIYKKQELVDFNKDFEYKLNSLLDDNEEPPLYFYIDVDIINLFYNVRQDLSKYNYDSYKNTINCVDRVLNIKNDIEKKLCDNPKVPDIKKNFTPKLGTSLDLEKDTPEELSKKEFNERNDFLNVSEYNLKSDTVCDSTLTNAYENYQIAEENTLNALNHFNSMIISLPSEPVIHSKHEKASKRLHLLLKRNLDDIKKIYDKKLKKGLGFKSNIITDYDLPKPLNKYNDNKGTFDFY